MDAHKQPAFPNDTGNVFTELSGLTKREYFAAMAMQGMLARDDRYGFEEAGKVACFYADGLLRALERKPE